MSRDHVLSLRLGDDEHARLMEYLNRPGRSYGSISDAARQMLLDHAAEPAICMALKPGTWASGYIPVCQLPARHRALKHWWRDDKGNEMAWDDRPELGHTWLAAS